MKPKSTSKGKKEIRDWQWIGGKACTCVHGKEWFEGDNFERFGGRACEECIRNMTPPKTKRYNTKVIPKSRPVSESGDSVTPQAKDWEEEYQKIMHNWFKRVVMLELDDDLIGKIRGKKAGFWTIRNYEAEEFIRSLFHSNREEVKKELVEKIEKLRDRTPDADEYERADRMAWNACLDQLKSIIEEI